MGNIKIILFISTLLLFFNTNTKAQKKVKPVVKQTGSTIEASLENLPIKPSRTISFTTDEASWIDVDISTDGKTLLCSFLGNIYSLPSTGGTAKQLTRGLAINRNPVWSPDGKLKAYISDATGFIRVHIADSTGNFHKALGEVKNQMEPEHLTFLWLPDSKHVLIGNEIHDLNGASSELPKDMKKIFGFSYDGKLMYYIEELSKDSSAITRLHKETGEKTRLLVYDKPWYNLDFYNGRISPDGNWLCYVKFDWIDGGNGKSGPADSLMIIDLKSTKEKLLAHLGIKFTGFGNNQHFCFSKDSKYLFIGYKGKIHRIEITTGNNEVIQFVANVKVDMGALNYHRFPVSVDSFEVKYIRSAQKRPDGKQLVFSALNKIYTMDLPNDKPQVLVEQPFGQFQPTFSPDGKWICYVSWSDTDGGLVWRIPSFGGDPEQVTTEHGLYMHPSWSPDGKNIVVTKGVNNLSDNINPGEGEIEVINVWDKTIKSYADKISLFNYPKFSKDGKQVLFKPKKNNEWKKLWPKLVSLDLQTKERNDLATAIKKEDYTFSIRQIVSSPDGKYLVFSFNGDLYLTPRTNIGFPQMIFNEKEFTTIIRFVRGGIDANWGQGGTVLSWVSGNYYYEIDADKIMKAALNLGSNKTLEGLPKTKIIDVDIPADQKINIHLKAQSFYGKGTIALKNARIITMHAKNVIENGIIVIKNGRIVNVGEIAKVKIPEGAEVFDLNGKTIIPGFIDMHGHIGSACPPDIFHLQSWEQLLTLSYGVTTLRDPGGSFDQFGYSELWETDQTTGPRLFTLGGHVREEYNLSSLKEAEEAVMKRKQMGGTVVKQYSQPTRLQRQLLLQACKNGDLNMTNEVEQEPLYCIGQIKDGSTGVEHNPVWGEVYDDVIRTVSKSMTYLCPTLQVCRGFDEGKHYFHKLYGQDFINRSARFMSDTYRKQLEREINEDVLDTGFLLQSKINARIKHAGGKIVMGSHGDDKGIGAHWEIWALQMGGLTNMEALQTATITAAEGLGMQKDLGSIEVGKIADLIILDKNPLEDIQNTNTIKYVMKAGVLYESETLDQIWPEKKKCPEWRMKSEVKN